jgi:hypothetical protein
MEPLFYKDKEPVKLFADIYSAIWVEKAKAKRKCQACLRPIMPGELCLCHEVTTHKGYWPNNPIAVKKSRCVQCAIAKLDKRVHFLKEFTKAHNKMKRFLNAK